MEWEALIAQFLAYDMADIVRTVSLLLALLMLGVFADRSTWLVTDVLANIGMGVVLVAIPGPAISYVAKGTPSAVHIFLARLTGMYRIGSALLPYRTKESRDGTVHITVLLSRVFTWSIILLCQVHTYFLTTKGKKNIQWNDEFPKLIIYSSALILIGHLIHLLRSYDFMTYPQCNIRLNTHLRLDAWLMVLAAALMLAFPDYVMNKIFEVKTANCVHVYVLHCLGAMDLGEAFVSVQAPGFLHEQDKRSQLLCRFVHFSLALPPCLWACYGPDPTITPTQMYYIIAMMAPSALNALVGYFLDGTTIYKVPERREERRTGGAMGDKAKDD